ncbi:hypothetical protein D6833_13865 [Candidatus Parcubacteria bacterium]|nr:MAG: hypothetical protein D6833_13865 [Candidatus Parcubacteria bacterium]
MMQHEFEILRNMLIEYLTELIGDADVALNGNHPYWDGNTVEAMADAALAVVKAVDAAEQNIYQAG